MRGFLSLYIKVAGWGVFRKKSVCWQEPPGLLQSQGQALRNFLPVPRNMGKNRTQSGPAERGREGQRRGSRWSGRRGRDSILNLGKVQQILFLYFFFFFTSLPHRLGFGATVLPLNGTGVVVLTVTAQKILSFYKLYPEKMTKTTAQTKRTLQPGVGFLIEDPD